MNTRAPPALLLVFLLIASLLAAQPVSATADVTALTVTSNGRTVERPALLDGTNPFISSLNPMAISVSFGNPDADPATTQIIGTAGTLHYTFNGANPTAASASIPLAAAEDALPGTTQTMTGTIPVANWTGANAGALGRFIVIPDGADGENLATFPSSGAYTFRLESTRPLFQSFSIPTPPGSSVQKPVTQTAKPKIEFHIRDSALESTPDYATPTITIDGVDATSSFSDTRVSDFDHRYTYTYPAAAPDFAEGDHTITISVSDGVGHTPNPFVFAVDNTAPVIGNITGIPHLGIAAGTKSITAIGAAVNVSAIATDLHLNQAGNDLVMRFVNSTRGISSAPTPLVFEAGGLWRQANALIPLSLPREAYELAIQITATDQAGNIATRTSPNLLIIDPEIPTVDAADPGRFLPVAPHPVTATVTDDSAGLVADGVLMHWINITGNVTGNISGFELADGFYEVAMTLNDDGDYEATLPAAEHGATLSYFVSATDRAGNVGTSTLFVVTYDGVVPIVTESPPQPFRGQPPYHFCIYADDGTGSGVDPRNVTLFFSLDGGSSYQTAVMTAAEACPVGLGASPPSPQALLFQARVDVELLEGENFEYYFEARDGVGNVGALGNETTRLVSNIDRTPPSFAVNSPTTAAGPSFELELVAVDPGAVVNNTTAPSGAGISHYDVFARVQGQSTWIHVLQETILDRHTVCAQANLTYEFTGFATDFAGNAGTRSDAPLATTAVTGESCSEPIIITVTGPAQDPARPNAKPRFDAGAGGATIPVSWTAESGLTIAPPNSLRIQIEFSPDNQFHWFVLATDLDNTGAFELPGTLPDCSRCFIRVTATSQITGQSAAGQSSVFEIFNGDSNTDLDGNGLLDAWELRHFGRLGLAVPRGDSDQDNLNNRQESDFDTNPNLRDTDGDEFTDGFEVKIGTDPLDADSFPDRIQARSLQFTIFYWAVPLVWAGGAITFFIGLARRW